MLRDKAASSSKTNYDSNDIVRTTLISQRGNIKASGVDLGTNHNLRPTFNKTPNPGSPKSKYSIVRGST
jgi:hypothetical protein